jgi:hypothetical protein
LGELGSRKYASVPTIYISILRPSLLSTIYISIYRSSAAILPQMTSILKLFNYQNQVSIIKQGFMTSNFMFFGILCACKLGFYLETEGN